jgi:hypothetical protein
MSSTAKSLDRSHAMLQQTIKDAKIMADKLRDANVTLQLIQLKLVGK